MILIHWIVIVDAVVRIVDSTGWTVGGVHLHGDEVGHFEGGGVEGCSAFAGCAFVRIVGYSVVGGGGSVFSEVGVIDDADGAVVVVDVDVVGVD